MCFSLHVVFHATSEMVCDEVTQRRNETDLVNTASAGSRSKDEIEFSVFLFIQGLLACDKSPGK